MAVRIYVITHKETRRVTPSPTYKRLFVGAALHEPPSRGYLRDNEGGDGISAKNQTFCELTGLYWIWKHSRAKFAGLVHYRRYLFGEACPERRHSKLPAAPFLLEAGEVKRILTDEKKDIILPEQYLLNEYTVYTHYKTFHHIGDLMCCRQIISEHCPEYLPAFDEVMEWKKIYHANMMVTSKERFDDYCAWLFDILFEAERRIDISEYDDYQKRIFGFLSERLLNVWVRHHGLKVQTRPVYDPAEFLV